MKRNLLKLALCAMALLPLGAWADEPDFGTDAVVSTTTVWTFNNSVADTNYGWDNEQTAYTTVADDNSRANLYARTYTYKDKVNCTFTVTELAEPTTVTFTDGWKVSISKVLRQNQAIRNPNRIPSTATASTVNDKVYYLDNTTTKNETYTGAGMLAFNATVAGTLYVICKTSEASKNIRFCHINEGTNIYECTVNEVPVTSTCLKYKTVSTNGTVQCISYTTTNAGTFYFGGSVETDIYAVRFVPTSEKPKDIVYIGATGYATYGNNTDIDLDVPAGLTAYKAKPGNSSVTLTSLGGIPYNAGVILKGTPNTNYPLTASATTYTVNNNWLVRVTANATLGQTNGSAGDALRYNYILANDGGVAKFFKPDGTSTISKGKAYLQTKTELSAPGGARGFSIIFEDDETTGITSTKVEKGDDSWYTLQGVKVAQPTKGIYVKNGKKVVVK